jgi:SAM-dependent MidA family methyltransferase
MSQAAEKLAHLAALEEAGGGRIRFDRWMEAALYHPAFGYYAASIRGIGRRGDFTTWPVADRSLARGLAEWIRRHRNEGGGAVIEIGAGTGELADGVLRELGWWRRPAYHIVEISRPLRAEQQRRLGRRATWHESPAAALAACAGRALLLSNELFDAFPCRIFRRAATGWDELFLRRDGGRFQEIWSPADARPESTVWEHPWPEGQRVEVQESIRPWLADWLPRWTAGRLLAIDYGAVCPALFHRRPRGTLRAYAHQQRFEAPEAYAGFGTRDLTVDVNFSDLAGMLDPRAVVTTLGAFLQPLAALPARLAEAGAAFHVLETCRHQPAG